MSAANQELLLKLAMRLGAKQTEDHANFIRKMERWIDQVFDDNLTIEEKECVLHKIGLADNKIDTDPDVKLYKKKLAREIRQQKIFIKWGQFQNLEESENRCLHYVKEILRKISPRSLDIGAEFEEMNKKDKKRGRATV